MKGFIVSSIEQACGEEVPINLQNAWSNPFGVLLIANLAVVAKSVVPLLALFVASIVKLFHKLMDSFQKLIGCGDKDDGDKHDGDESKEDKSTSSDGKTDNPLVKGGEGEDLEGGGGVGMVSTKKEKKADELVEKTVLSPRACSFFPEQCLAASEAVLADALLSNLEVDALDILAACERSFAELLHRRRHGDVTLQARAAHELHFLKGKLRERRRQLQRVS